MQTIINKLSKKARLKALIGVNITTLLLSAGVYSIANSYFNKGWNSVNMHPPSKKILELIVKKNYHNSKEAAVEYLRQNQEILDSFKKCEDLILLQRLFPVEQKKKPDHFSELDTVDKKTLLGSIRFLSDKQLSDSLYILPDGISLYDRSNHILCRVNKNNNNLDTIVSGIGSNRFIGDKFYFTHRHGLFELNKNSEIIKLTTKHTDYHIQNIEGTDLYAAMGDIPTIIDPDSELKEEIASLISLHPTNFVPLRIGYANETLYSQTRQEIILTRNGYSDIIKSDGEIIDFVLYDTNQDGIKELIVLDKKEETIEDEEDKRIYNEINVYGTNQRFGCTQRLYTIECNELYGDIGNYDIRFLSPPQLIADVRSQLNKTETK